MNKKVNGRAKTSNKRLIPIILLMGFVPLIVHMYQYHTNLSQYDWFPNGSEEQSDFFFAWKMIAIIVIGLVMVGILAYRYFKEKESLRFENSFYMLFFYAMFVAMSALFSTHKYWVVRGMHALFEPVWIVFIYILLCYYTYNSVREENQVKFVLKIAGIGMTLVALIGVFQFFGHDIFKTPLGKRLITNPSWWNSLDQLSFNLGERTSYTTLYNPNFLSFYFGMLIPLVACLFIATKTVWQKVILVVAEVLCMICLNGSGSDSGWMAIAIGFAIVILVLASRKKIVFYTVLAVMLLGGILGVTVGTKTEIGSRIKDTVIGTYHMNDRFALQEIRIEDDSAVLNIRGNDLHIAYSVADGQAWPTCWDTDGQQLDLVALDDGSNKYQINDSRYDGVYIQPIQLGDDIPAVSVMSDNIDWRFVNIEGDGYYYCNAAGKLVRPEKAKDADLFNEDAMSSRGHIWNMTIPLLGKHVFIGAGANTYALEYPQDDYIGQECIYGANSFQIKAHSWYLQQWVETGLLGTIILLVFLGWYVVQSIRIYRRANLHESLSWVGFGLFAAVLVYLIAGIANDSNVCTAPVFWGMLGLGLATNRMISEKEGLFVKETVIEETDVKLAAATKESGAHAGAGKDQEKTIGNVQNTNKKQAANKKQSRKQRKNQKK